MSRAFASLVCAAAVVVGAPLSSNAQDGSAHRADGFDSDDAYDDPLPLPPTDCYPPITVGEDDIVPEIRAPFHVTAMGRVPDVGRIVVATANTSIQPPRVAVYYTDDEGESWQRARGHFHSAIRVLAFALEGGHGTAAGNHGAISTTRDGGATWRRHGVTERGTCFVYVYVRGQATVLVDQDGRVYRSRRGGAERTLVVDDPEAIVRAHPDDIEIVTRGRRYRVLSDGNLQPP